METTATLLPDGWFDIHTPIERAAKCASITPRILNMANDDCYFRYMPPTSPVVPGFSCISIVFARTIVGGEDHGIKPYAFQLHDGQSMTPGVKVKYAMISRQIPLAVN
jgi:acyl-CoA oxidase